MTLNDALKLPEAGEESEAEASVVKRRRSEIRAVRRPLGGQLVAERFRLVRELGCGSSGKVFEAADLLAGELVAVKLLHPHLRAHPTRVARFARELKATAAVGHPAVVEVIEAGAAADGTLYLAMERLYGELLLHRIDRCHRLELADALRISREILRGLDAAHAKGIVHRDIKPENIILEASENGEVTKILDFGVAKLISDSPDTFQTLAGHIVGTPEYMSPQACRGAPVTAAMDLWSVGAVLFQMLTGHPPFEDDHIGRLISKIAMEPAPEVRSYRPDIPAAIAEVVDRALHSDPTVRWENALQFERALARCSFFLAD